MSIQLRLLVELVAEAAAEVPVVVVAVGGGGAGREGGVQGAPVAEGGVDLRCILAASLFWDAWAVGHWGSGRPLLHWKYMALGWLAWQP
jgi:hypothetical protein